MVGRGVTAGGRLAFPATGSDRRRTNLSLAPRALSPRQSAVVYTVRGFDKFLGILNHLNPEISLSCLPSTHPLQVRAGRNQLQPLLVTMTDGELLHAWGLSSTCRAASHAIRAWRGALLYLQVREWSGEASVFAMLRLKLLNLFLTFLPVQPLALLSGWVTSKLEVSATAPIASWRLSRFEALRRREAAHTAILYAST